MFGLRSFVLFWFGFFNFNLFSTKCCYWWKTYSPVSDYQTFHWFQWEKVSLLLQNLHSQVTDDVCCLIGKRGRKILYNTSPEELGNVYPQEVACCLLIVLVNQVWSLVIQEIAKKQQHGLSLKCRCPDCLGMMGVYRLLCSTISWRQQSLMEWASKQSTDIKIKWYMMRR